LGFPSASKLVVFLCFQRVGFYFVFGVAMTRDLIGGDLFAAILGRLLSIRVAT
jgi:hypothetical protein